MRVYTLLFLIVVSGCASNAHFANVARPPEIPPLPSKDISSFVEKVNHQQPVKNIISLEKVFELSESQKEKFLKAFQSKYYRSFNPNRRVYEYLKNYLTNFNFYSDTLVASEALNKQLGNCLSLAIVTKALAETVGIHVGYELVSTTPVFQREGEITLASQHVRTILYNQPANKEPNTFTIGVGNIIVDYFPSRGSHRLRRVSEAEFYSMYYRNKAAEELVKNDLINAFNNAQVALKYAPMEAQAINLMAVIHHRAGFKATADEIYRYALKYGKESLELLGNYHSFLILNKRYEEASNIQKKLDQYEDLNPFVWVDLGNSAYVSKNYIQAIRYFKRAVKMADYIHEPYLGMARSYFMIGQIKTAKYMMKKALEKSHKNETRTIYQKKYEMLSKLASQ